jgi:hypothetical protein
MKSLRLSLAALLCIAAPAVAFAQEEAKKPAPPEGGGTDVEMEEDTPPEDMEGTSENPDAPKQVNGEVVEGPVAPKAVRTGYPMEEVLRPITLPAVMTEIGLDVRSNFDPVDTEFGLRARFGITKQAQIGVRYGIGGLYEDGVTMKSGFNTGKAFGLDFTYLVFDWMAGKITLPMYVDPFAMAVTLGAPMKFVFKEKYAIVALDDFLEIRILKFIPSLTNESANEFNVFEYNRNTSLRSSNVYLRVGGIYQMKPNMAIKANLKQTIPGGGDNEASTSNETPLGLEGIFQFSPNAKMDVTGRLGIEDLASPGETFGLVIAAAYRI